MDFKIVKLTGASFALANALFALLLHISIGDFFRSEVVSKTLTLSLALVFLCPLLFVLLTGRWWLSNPIRRLAIQACGLGYAVVVNLLLMVDACGYSEWIGFPPVMQMGYLMLYSFYTPVFYLSGMLAVFFLFVLDFDTGSAPEVKTHLWIPALFVGGGTWLLVTLFLKFSIFWVVFFQNLVLSVFLILRLLEIFHLRSTRDAPSSVPQPQSIEKISPTHKEWRGNLPNGLRNFFKLMGVFLPLGFCLVGALNLTNQLLQLPNYMPLLGDFLPLVLLTGLLWVAFHSWVKNRAVLAVGSLLACLVALLLASLDLYSILTFQQPILWLSAATLSGTLLSITLYIPNMVTRGAFSHAMWVTIGPGLGIIGLIAGGILLDTDLYSQDIWQYGIPVLTGVLGLFLLFTIGKYLFTRHRNKTGESPIPQQAPPVVGMQNVPALSREHRTNFLQSVKAQGKFSLLVAIVIGGLVVSPFLLQAGWERASSERVLGTYDGDYYLWYADGMRTIDRNYAPFLDSANINNTVHIQMARGEVEGFQVVFTPGKLKNLDIISFQLDAALNHTGTGAKIGAGNVSVYQLEYVPQLHEQYPDRLYPFKRVETAVSIENQKNYPFYVSVTIPADGTLLSGTYIANMTFHCQDYRETPYGVEREYKARDVKINLEVEVFNFTISTQRHIATEIIWGIPNTPTWYSFFGNHRMDAYWPYVPILNFSHATIEVNINWTKWIADLSTGFANGMNYFPVSWYPTGFNFTSKTYNSSALTIFQKYISDIAGNLSLYAAPDGASYLDHAYFFVIDEPGELAMYNFIVNISQRIHEKAPTLRIMETMNHEMELYPQAFLEEVDIYCPHFHAWVPSSAYPGDANKVINGWPQRIKTLLETWSGPRKKELWVYSTSNGIPYTDTDIDMSGVEQRNIYWLCWTYGIAGWLYWSFNWGFDMEGGLGYRGFGESTLIGYDVGENPLSSLRLERVRDGAEDFEYFWLLNASLTYLETNGRSTEAQIGRGLLQQVNQLYNQPEHLAKVSGLFADDEPETIAKRCYNPYAAPYLALRSAIGVEIARLRSLGVP